MWNIVEGTMCDSTAVCARAIFIAVVGFLHSLVYLMLSAACCQNRIYVSFDDEWQMKAVGWEEN